jgi:hypothetical protein
LDFLSTGWPDVARAAPSETPEEIERARTRRLADLRRGFLWDGFARIGEGAKGVVTGWEADYPDRVSPMWEQCVLEGVAAGVRGKLIRDGVVLLVPLAWQHLRARSPESGSQSTLPSKRGPRREGGAAMSNHSLARAFASLVIAGFLFAPSARAELASWDQAQVTAFAKELKTATDAFYDTFIQQPAPGLASMQSQAYFRLKQIVRLLRIEAGHLATSLEKGEGREQTLPIYENLMQLARSARDDAGKVFVTHEVGDRAGAVRGVLNKLGPYYDPDFPMIAPHPNIEPGAAR